MVAGASAGHSFCSELHGCQIGLTKRLVIANINPSGSLQLHLNGQSYQFLHHMKNQTNACVSLEV